jgi:hypothetical protein
MATHLTGYNLYVGVQMKKLMDIPWQQRLGAVALAWRNLSPEDQAVWNRQAHEQLVFNRAAAPIEDEPQKKFLTAYHRYVQRNTEVLATSITDGQLRMQHIIASWRALSPIEKEAWAC